MTKNRFKDLCKECDVTITGYSGNHKKFFVSGTQENLGLLSQYVDEAWPFSIEEDK